MNRFVEPSTWAALAALLVAAKAFTPPAWWPLLEWAAPAMAGLGVVLKERAS